MEIYQEHFGRKFYQDKDKGYWISSDYSKERPRIRAHRWVWMCVHGKIPPGYHIHHKNEDKSDNCIENLELIEKSRHLSIHCSEEKKEWARKRMEELRPLTKEWHASEEGRTWHRLHALKCGFGNWEETEYICLCCQSKYKSRKKSRTSFCSNNCKSQWRREQGLDDIEKTCPVCEKVYVINKYARNKTCSRSCSQQNRFKSNF